MPIGKQSVRSLAIAFALVLLSMTAAEAAPPRPNIVLVLCDDLGYSDVGFNGAKDIRTPALDALARGGTICTSGYVAHPFCGPSRMALMTGRYPHTFGAPFNLPNSGQGIESYNKQGVDPKQTLIGSVLQKAGYFTGAVGKWHMGIRPEFHPNARGFDEFFGFLGGGHKYFPSQYQAIYDRQRKAGRQHINEYVVPLERDGEPVRETEYLTDAFSREAVKFVERAAKKDQPFFLYLAYNAPHSPLEATEEDLKLYAHIEDEKRRTYAAMVHAVDRGVGQLVVGLKKTGAYENTLIVFLSDNGGKLSLGATNRPLKQGKGSTYEGGYRVPFFFHWPKHIPTGKRFDHPVTALDFYPTLAKLAGVRLPEAKNLDGKDIWADVVAGRNPRAGEMIYALRHRAGFHDVGIRQDRWKLTKAGRTARWQLFDLEADVGEKHDLSAKHPERVRQMAERAEKWSRDHTTPLWYDSLQAEKAWKNAGMPKYKATFRVEQSRPQQKPSDPHRNTTKKPHILFIAIDDLRPELGCYGSKLAKSPNLDKLASQGLLFRRAYCQQAICSPSRASLMTGARPDTIGVIENTAYFRELNPDIVTLPQHLIANGYETVYCGKIFHGRMTDNENSWSRKPAWKRCPVTAPKTPGGYALPENQELWAENRKKMLAKYGQKGASGLIHGPAYESADVPDHAYRDGFNTRLAIATLEQHLAKKDGKPLFLGLGFTKPHLDFNAPKKYWDMYDPKEIALASQTSAPENGAAMGLHASFELRTRHGIPKKGPIGDDLARTLLHGYYACVSYVDAQIGMMLAALDKAGIRDNTIIIVWGDHGWHLGDMGVWGKATNYEIATRVPLIIWTPTMKTRGKASDALVELVDMYPTLCELAGVPTPKHSEGHSFAPLLDEPDRAWKKAAFSQFPTPALREWAANPLSPGMRQTFFGPLIEGVEKRIIAQQGERWNRELFEKHLMGYTMRTDRYRLVEWRDRRDPKAEPVFVELYDHKTDPHETKNVARENPEFVEKLRQQLKAGWKSALR